ncbi:MAG: enoyl-CoA hydratase/isomerase family protein [Candidatus Acidiferrales bacterium]
MLRIEQLGSVAILTLAHGKASAMDLEFCRALSEQFEKLRTSDARAVIVTGAGNIFSAGVDLLRLTGEGAGYMHSFIGALTDFFEAATTFAKPLVAAINGHAIAGGCILACCADRRVMARGPGRIGVPELQVGVPFPRVALELVRLTVAPQYLQEVVYSGQTFTGEDALQRGLIDELAEPADLAARAMEHATRFAALPPGAFAITKQQLRQPLVAAIREARDGDAAVKDYWASPAALDSIRAYVARTLKKK